jgi:hypothetical protein
MSGRVLLLFGPQKQYELRKETKGGIDAPVNDDEESSGDVLDVHKNIDVIVCSERLLTETVKWWRWKPDALCKLHS